MSPDVYLPSIIDTEEFGEENLPRALGYDVISQTKIRNFKRLDLPKEVLAYEHKKRIRDSILFTHYENLKAWRKAQKEENFFDLNIDIRRAKKEKAEIELLNMENETRKKLGLSTFDTYQSFLDREEDQEETPDIEEEILLEAANVLSDFIKQSYNPAAYLNQAS